MIRSLLLRLTARLPHPRIIFDRAGRSPYLSRWYLLNSPTMPDGSWPFDASGGPRDGIRWSEERWGLYLHRFHRGDDDQELHNHPWRWALSLILVGGYWEERRVSNGLPFPGYRVERRIVRPWTFNRIDADDFHRVDLLEEDAWSLFFVGPKFQSWGFWNRETERFMPWRDFINKLRDPASFARSA